MSTRLVNRFLVTRFQSFASRPLLRTRAGLASVPALAFATAALFGVFTPQPAQAGIDACNDIYVEASAQCEVVVGAACETRCEPATFELVCAAELQAQCEGECNAQIDQVCTETCTTACVPDCTLDPGKFECQAKCDLNCSSQCDAHCESKPNDTHCHATCEAECSAKCTACCEVQQPALECTEKCAEICGASCEAQANIDCQVECQGKAFAECESKFTGGCKTECQKPEGALFCDGQFIDHGGNLDACVDALNAYLSTKVTVHGEAEGECTGNECHGEVSGGVHCALAPAGDSSARWLWLLAALPILGRRRNRGAAA